MTFYKDIILKNDQNEKNKINFIKKYEPTLMMGLYFDV